MKSVILYQPGRERAGVISTVLARQPLNSLTGSVSQGREEGREGVERLSGGNGRWLVSISLVYH